ncbi:hypothetical protein Ciccas_008881 [Cichlidogyrus casuarinus]|uniref:Uncharacterized protein n=1 Tax=Cichlidogyrus casuarinus TaxID=1844966 RepID=A0ABD2PYM4_9PLAT
MELNLQFEKGNSVEDFVLEPDKVITELILVEEDYCRLLIKVKQQKSITIEMQLHSEQHKTEYYFLVKNITLQEKLNGSTITEYKFDAAEKPVSQKFMTKLNHIYVCKSRMSLKLRSETGAFVLLLITGLGLGEIALSPFEAKNLPNYDLRWKWSFIFDTAQVKHEFAPLQSQVQLNSQVEKTGDQYEELTRLKFSITPNSALSPFSLTADLYQRKIQDVLYFTIEELFISYEIAGSNIMFYFDDPERAVSKKFLTPIKNLYKCESEMELPLRRNNHTDVIYMKLETISIAAYTVDGVPIENMEEDRCPLDMRSNVPISALVGISVLIIVACITLPFLIPLIRTKILENKKSA